MKFLAKKKNLTFLTKNFVCTQILMQQNASFHLILFKTGKINHLDAINHKFL